ncbi:MAG: thiamine phosphate synthase [Acidobacteria bacterium]|nr:MAG: thiamine phosphate synthase [Acidobacteriota bacterium]PYS85177.1 MAG: thiamine phosphate synthase [Acidobacteriota bacterium]
MPFELPKLYPITDRRLSGLSHAAQVARLCEGGARLVQLREKHLSPREFYREAEGALKVARSRGVRLVINDRADIALAVGADGVHLGQDDMPPDAARALLGEGAVIGFSTHGVEQAVAAARLPVDYIAIGPVFATQSKENPDPSVGLEGVARVREAVGRLPLVAIGGITQENARSVLDAGADSVAVISALLAPADPAEIARRMGDFIARL